LPKYDSVNCPPGFVKPALRDPIYCVTAAVREVRKGFEKWKVFGSMNDGPRGVLLRIVAKQVALIRRGDATTAPSVPYRVQDWGLDCCTEAGKDLQALARLLCREIRNAARQGKKRDVLEWSDDFSI